MSKFQITTIQKVMGFTPEQAEILIRLMDLTSDHPDWSEASDTELRRHFKMVMVGE
jgi:hypothetical protein